MKPPALGTAACERLYKLLGMLGSAHDGERAAAGLKAHEFLKRLGLRWVDVIRAPSIVPPDPPDDEDIEDWDSVIEFCWEHAASLNTKERDFVDSMRSWDGPPTEKQANWLRDIFRRLARGRR